MADNDTSVSVNDELDREDEREPSLTIELNSDRELAAPSPALSVEQGEQREETEREESEEEKRRRRMDADATQDGPQASSAGEASQDQEKEKQKEPDRSFPADIQSGYYIRTDRAGDQHVYADSKGNREVFQESATKLRTKLNDPHAVKLMLDTAAHRGWSSITVKGSQEFRREAWLEGQARGIAVSGYKPNELDQQELKRREQAYLRNEIQPDREAERERSAGEPAAMDVRDHTDAPRQAGSPEAGVPLDQSRADRSSPDYKHGIEGLLIEAGERPYRDNPKNEPSPYVVLQDASGRQQTVWGVGLPDALLKAGAREGDQIRLRELGMERVMKTVIREVNGRPVRFQQEVDRRAWEADVTREREAGEAQREGTELKTADDRRDREGAAEREVAQAVAGAERTLHVGPGRDAALEDGVYANEVRAKEYRATGRAGAAHNPELRGAAALEAYVERKVRQKYPGDPVVVQRAMNVARTKIGNAIARGHDFPQPRVIEEREIDRAAKDHEQNRREESPDRAQETRPAREQLRDHNRATERSR